MKQKKTRNSFLIFKLLFFPFWILYLICFKKPDPHVIGERYERQICRKLRRRHFTNVQQTPRSGDHGIDIIAFKYGKSYAIQCKYYTIPVSNRAVQEAYSGCSFYGCDIPVVVTNNTFTRPAIREAEQNGVELWAESRIPRLSPASNWRHVLYCLWMGLLALPSIGCLGSAVYFQFHGGNPEYVRLSLMLEVPCLLLLILSRQVHRFFLNRKLKNLTPP